MNSSRPTRVVVYVRRGFVEEVVADSMNVEVLVVDYDNEGVSGQMERYFECVPCDSERVRRSRAGIDVR